MPAQALQDEGCLGRGARRQGHHRPEPEPQSHEEHINNLIVSERAFHRTKIKIHQSQRKPHTTRSNKGSPQRLRYIGPEIVGQTIYVGLKRNRALGDGRSTGKGSPGKIPKQVDRGAGAKFLASTRGSNPPGPFCVGFVEPAVLFPGSPTQQWRRKDGDASPRTLPTT